MNEAIENKGSLAMSEGELLEVLGSSLYPGAAANSIKLVIGYCKAANLDPMQKPVHIVPMWDKNAKAMRDVIMPGIGLYRTQATRSNALAGISEPEFGPSVEFELSGAKFTVPEWCKVIVKRLLPNNSIAEYAACEYWIENYATAGKDSIAPNAMWKKRPRGQLAKCAQAQALRMAFPEMTGSAPTAEEMEGKYIDVDEGGLVAKQITHTVLVDIEPMIKEALATTTDKAALDYWKENSTKLIKQPQDYKRFKDAVAGHRDDMRKKEEVVDDEFVKGLDSAPEYAPE